MKAYIIMILVNAENEGIKDAKKVENMVFDTKKSMHETMNKIDETFCCELSKFMDWCNNKDINLNNYWISHVYVK